MKKWLDASAVRSNGPDLGDWMGSQRCADRGGQHPPARPSVGCFFSTSSTPRCQHSQYLGFVGGMLFSICAWNCRPTSPIQ